MRPAAPVTPPLPRSGGEGMAEEEPAFESDEEAEEQINQDGAGELDPMRRVISAWMGQDREPKSLGSVFLAAMEETATPLGRFRQEFETHAVAQGELGAFAEVLPISITAVQKLPGLGPEVHDWVAAMCWVLNFQFCSGFGSAKYMRHSKSLSTKQMDLIRSHLEPAVIRAIQKKDALPSIEVVDKELARKGHNYDGTSYVEMEELVPSKVLECWPKRGEAAVARLEDFLDGETKGLVLTPQETLLPREEWPEKIPKSYVRATDADWEELVTEGVKLGLFQECPEEEILVDQAGRKILNGAGAVVKMKGDRTLQRFISIFVPLNSVSKKIEGDEATLPYVGQVNLVNVPDECELVVDSEDMASAFNLFGMPKGWRGLFVYEKQVPARCFGHSSDKPTFVSLKTVPMGWVSAVGTVQAAIRHLAFSIAKLPGSAEVQKWKELPADNKLILYLDSIDQLRIVSKAMLKLVEGQESEEHRRFREACESKGLPTNAAKAGRCKVVS